MEANKVTLTESNLRSIISEELEVYLVTEGFLSNLKDKTAKLKAQFNPIIFASLLLGVSTKPAAIAQAEFTNDEQTQEFFKIIDQQQNKLQALGLTDEAATKIISGVLDGAKNSKEKELQTSASKITDEEMQEQILDYQKEQIAKINNRKKEIELIKSIFCVLFILAFFYFFPFNSSL